MTKPPVSVVKIGGSLLQAADFPRRFQVWLDVKSVANPDTHFVLVAGGGPWVEGIRQLDAHSPLGDERAHWLCVAIMDITAGLVGAMLPQLCLVKTFAELEARLCEPGCTLLAPCEFVQRVEPRFAGNRLPAYWSVTSDSIAGRLAIVLGATELTLLKSIPPPERRSKVGDLSELASAGYVDAFLPALGVDLPPVEFSVLPPE